MKCPPQFTLLVVAACYLTVVASAPVAENRGSAVPSLSETLIAARAFGQTPPTPPSTPTPVIGGTSSQSSSPRPDTPSASSPSSPRQPSRSDSDASYFSALSSFDAGPPEPPSGQLDDADVDSASEHRSFDHMNAQQFSLRGQGKPEGHLSRQTLPPEGSVKPSKPRSTLRQRFSSFSLRRTRRPKQGIPPVPSLNSGSEHEARESQSRLSFEGEGEPRGHVNQQDLTPEALENPLESRLKFLRRLSQLPSKGIRWPQHGAPPVPSLNGGGDYEARKSQSRLSFEGEGEPGGDMNGDNSPTPQITKKRSISGRLASKFSRSSLKRGEIRPQQDIPPVPQMPSGTTGGGHLV